ncbi:hypothetical protein [Terasakiella sp. SH-1]|uniref:hypothetical protein n=1 Tax=Terasakiella sp. SH-1 TaxID=2560057 RepID=UPI0010735AF6|nr:hypothetical protein [Terasakiella sp. SH-1]
MFEELDFRFSNALSSFDAEQLQILAAYYRAMADQFDARAQQLIDYPSSPPVCKRFAKEVRTRIVNGQDLEDALEDCERYFQVDQRLFKADFFRFYGENAIEKAVADRPANVNKRIIKAFKGGLTRQQLADTFQMPKGEISQIIKTWQNRNKQTLPYDKGPDWCYEA